MNKNIASYGVQILEELYKKYPKNPDIYNKLINAYISKNQYDKALNLIHKLPKYRIDNSTTAFRIWQAYINNNIEEEKKYFHNFFGKNFKLLNNQKTTLYINYFSGGLGNQLYYLAFANYLKNLGHSVKLLANQTNFDGDTLNPQQRNIIFDLPRKLGFELHFENDKTIQKLNLLRESHIIGIYNEPKDEFAYFHEVPKQIISNFNTIIFRGYFQSHQYLQSSFIPQLQNVIFNTLQEQGIRNYNINNHDVAVHIRRGDFLQYQLYEFIDISFYLKGLKHFNNIQRVFIFSDDFKSIQKEIKILSHQYQVICVKNQTVLEDMYLLMQFYKYVLGNSTFAWWGALLSYHNNPQVIVPKYPWNFSYKQINKTSQYPSTWIQLDNKPASIAILYIATGRYTIFWDTFYQSAENFLLPNHKKHYFVFTDTDEILIGENKNVTKIYQKHLGWPYDMLMRFDFFLKIKEKLMDFDYTFFFNANVKFVDKISTMDILPLNNQENLIVALHPSFYNKTKDKFTYDRNPKSLAYISENDGQHYFMGALNGGKVKNYLDMCEKLNHNIKIDLEKNIIALWHDESHLNRYMVNRTDLKILDISYLYPEGWKLPVKPKIILQDKSHSRFGGHNYLRQISNVKFHNFWKVSDTSHYWLYQFLQHHQLTNSHMTFYSVFGSAKDIQQPTINPKIFYTGENVYREFDNKYSQYQNYCLDYVDLSLGYEYIDHERYLRFPLWIKYLLPATVTKDEIHKRILEINNPSYRLQNNRYKFACLIASHDPQPFIRQSIVDLLSSIAPIDCAGHFLNNTNELKTLYNDNKVTYLKQFKFNICSENSRRSGYVTEKLFESIISGCIPVYWGDINPEPDILNQDAILFFEQDIQSQNKLLQKTSKLWHNEKLYQEFCRIPPFKADATEVLWQKLETLATKLQQLTYPKDKQP